MDPSNPASPLHPLNPLNPLSPLHADYSEGPSKPPTEAELWFLGILVLIFVGFIAWSIWDS